MVTLATCESETGRPMADVVHLGCLPISSLTWQRKTRHGRCRDLGLGLKHTRPCLRRHKPRATKPKLLQPQSPKSDTALAPTPSELRLSQFSIITLQVGRPAHCIVTA